MWESPQLRKGAGGSKVAAARSPVIPPPPPRGRYDHRRNTYVQVPSLPPSSRCRRAQTSLTGSLRAEKEEKRNSTSVKRKKNRKGFLVGFRSGGWKTTGNTKLRERKKADKAASSWPHFPSEDLRIHSGAGGGEIWPLQMLQLGRKPRKLSNLALLQRKKKKRGKLIIPKSFFSAEPTFLPPRSDSGFFCRLRAEKFSVRKILLHFPATSLLPLPSFFWTRRLPSHSSFAPPSGSPPPRKKEGE